jgi:chromate reductase
MTAPEAYIQFTPGLIDDDGTVTVESTREFLTSFMDAFYDYMLRVMAVIPRP